MAVSRDAFNTSFFNSPANALQNPVNAASSLIKSPIPTLQIPSLTVAQIDTAAVSNITSKINLGNVIPANFEFGNTLRDANVAIQTPLLQANTAVIGNIEEQVNKTLAPVFHTINKVNIFVARISSAIAEFKRLPYTWARQSPLKTAQQARDLICSIIDFAKVINLNVLFQWPPQLPQGLVNFSIKKFIAGLIKKIEEKIYKFIYNLIEQIKQKILAIIKKYYDMIVNFIKQILNLFICNPGDRY